MLRILLLSLMSVSIARATTLTGTMVSPLGGNATGTLYLDPPLNVALINSCGGIAGAGAPQRPYQITVTSGSLGAPIVLGNDCFNPGSTNYGVRFTDSVGNQFTGSWRITGSTTNVNTLVLVYAGGMATVQTSPGGNQVVAQPYQTGLYINSLFVTGAFGNPTGTGAPTGACTNGTSYIQQDATAGSNWWICAGTIWVNQVGGGGGGSIGGSGSANQYALFSAGTTLTSGAGLVSGWSGAENCTPTGLPVIMLNSTTGFYPCIAGSGPADHRYVFDWGPDDTGTPNNSLYLRDRGGFQTRFTSSGTGWILDGTLAVNPSTISTTGLATFKTMANTVNTVSFSATPTFNLALGNLQKITLTGNVTSSTASNQVAGQEIVFQICQDGTGSRTFVWPTSTVNADTIVSTASACTLQTFLSDGTNLFATSRTLIQSTGIVITNGSQIAVNTASILSRPTDQAGTDRFCGSATGNDTYTCTLTPTLTAYTDGGCFTLKPDTGNTLTASLAIDGLSAIQILNRAGGALATGDITANMPIPVCYNSVGPNFIIQGDGGGGNADAVLGNSNLGASTGPIPFMSAVQGTLTKNSTSGQQLWWDNTNFRFAVGNAAPTAGVHITKNGAASVPSMRLDGTIFSGGSATTTKPYFLLEPAGTTSAFWNTSGTLIGGNADGAFVGDLINVGVGGASSFSVTYAGLVNGNNASFGGNVLGAVSVRAGALQAFQSVPSVGTCGTLGTGSFNSSGFINSSTTGVCGPVITFTYTAPTGWSCHMDNSTTANVMRQVNSSTTTATFSGTTVSGDVLRYICVAY